MANQFLIKDTMVDMRGLSACEILALQSGCCAGVELLGYYEKGDTPTPIIYSLSTTLLADNGGSIVETGGIKLEHQFIEHVNALYFGVSVSLTDNAARLAVFFDYLKENKALEGILPIGTIAYSQTLNFVFEGAKLRGQGKGTILKFTGSADKAFEIDAFKGGTETTQFINNITISDIVFSGNANTTITLYLRGIARSKFSNVWVGDGKNSSDGYGWYLASVQLTQFLGCGCSKYLTPMTSVPYAGIFIGLGQRGSITAGNSTNNTFYQNYFEGLGIGVLMSQADENTFIGGSAEANSVYGIVVGKDCKVNTFIGVGLEANPVDVSDSSSYSTYTNCYFGNILRIGSTAKQISVVGAMIGRIEIQDGARYIEIKNSVYNRFKNGAKGIVDLGERTSFVNVEDFDSEKFIKQNIEIDGTVASDSYKVKEKNDILTPINSINPIGGFSPIIVKEAAPFWPTLGVALGVDRTGNFNDTNSISSFRIYSKSNTLDELYFTKKLFGTGAITDWSPLRRLIHDNNLATTTVKGIVSQSAVVANVVASNSAKSVLNDAADLATSVALVNDLKSKYNQAVDLINELKAQVNTKLQSDRASGQQAS
ncbi:hypothetical protein [Sphingobacterium ginsenosidimutans]|uniref:Peptidase S74 domain-containing protein n=1 Tax=Sphingobacterium ginsenosidimutans TaxID=687845 RepID=A0ABP8AAZ6_9SPHI